MIPKLRPITPKATASAVEPLSENVKAGTILETPYIAAAVIITWATGGTLSARAFMIRPHRALNEKP